MDIEDLTARLAAADLGWSHQYGDPPANPDYIRALATQVVAFEPRLTNDVLDELPPGACGPCLGTGATECSDCGGTGKEDADVPS